MNIIESLFAKKSSFLGFRLLSFIKTLSFYFINPNEVSEDDYINILVELLPDDKQLVDKLITKVNNTSSLCPEVNHALLTFKCALTGKLEILAGDCLPLEQYILSLKVVEELHQDHKHILHLTDTQRIVNKIKDVHNNNLYIETTMLEANLLDRLNMKKCAGPERKVIMTVLNSIRKYKDFDINSEVLIDEIKTEYANANRNLYTRVTGFFGKTPHPTANYLWDYLEVIRALQAIELLSPKRNLRELPCRTL